MLFVVYLRTRFFTKNCYQTIKYNNKNKKSDTNPQKNLWSQKTFCWRHFAVKFIFTELNWLFHTFDKPWIAQEIHICTDFLSVSGTYTNMQWEWNNWLLRQFRFPFLWEWSLTTNTTQNQITAIDNVTI